MLNKAMYGLVHGGLLWSKRVGTELEAKVFERSQADPCEFRRVLRGKVVIIVVCVNDLLVAGTTKRDEEQAMEDLCSFFPIKDL